MTLSKKGNKGRFYAKLPNGDFLSLTVWPGKKTANSEVVVAEVRHPSEKGWETISRIAVFRSPEGKYIQLPERRQENAKASA